MPLVHILFANDDFDIVGPLAEALREDGWECRLNSRAAGGSSTATPASESDAPPDGGCLLAVWSSNSVDTEQWRAAADDARRRGALVQARLDDAATPFGDDDVVDLTQWPEFPNARPPQTLTNALADAVGAPPPPPALPATSSEPPRPGLGAKDIIIIAVGLVLCVLAGVALVRAPQAEVVAGVEPAATSEPNPAAEAAEPPEPTRGPADDPVETEPTDETPANPLLAWAATPRDDAAALQRFIADHPNSALADEARDAFNRLEEETWERALAETGAGESLGALAAYSAAFPEGRYADEARSLAAAQRGRIIQAQRILAAVGFEPGDADGVPSPQTVAAVRQAERRLGREPSGRIDDDLLAALEARWPTVAAWIAQEEHKAPTAAASGANPDEDEPAAIAPAIDAAEPPSSFRDCYVCPRLAATPAGRFRMGDLAGQGEPGEQPTRDVEIAYALAIGLYEVTFEEWDACVGEGACSHRPNDQGWGRDTRPVIDVSRTDALTYLGWLSRKTGQDYRLLSEAEWEYAARAGAASPYAFGDDPADLCRFANAADAASIYGGRNEACTDGFTDMTAPVGEFEPNGFGLYDMQGNAAEWTADCWHASYDDAPSDGAAWTEDCDRAVGVVRGGGWDAPPAQLRAAARRPQQNTRSATVGFRVARPMAPE